MIFNAFKVQFSLRNFDKAAFRIVPIRWGIASLRKFSPAWVALQKNEMLLKRSTEAMDM